MNDRQPSASKAEILVVDDVPENLRLLSKMLTNRGYSVRKALNGNRALASTQVAPPDLILLDIKMPDMDGYEVCHRLKSNPETGEIPVIFLSALTDSHNIVKAFKMGGIDYITKPFKAEEVIARIENQLTIKTQKAQLQLEIKKREKAEATLQEHLQRVLLLQKITEEIRSSLDIQQIFTTAAQQIGKAFNVNRCTIYTYLTQPMPKITAVAEYLEPEQKSNLGREIILENNKFLDEVLAEDNAFFFDEFDAKFSLNISEDLEQCLDIKLIAMVRTSYQGKINGLISLEYCQNSRHWQENEIHLLECVAGSLGIAIAQAKLLEKLKKVNFELVKQAKFDGLTQVANRRYFDEYLTREWLRGTRYQQPLSLILCDLDYFKLYNDCYGHLMGDKCLIKVAEVMSKVVKRAGDLVARYGGEEFGIILPNTPPEGAIKIAEAMRLEVENLKVPHAQSKVSKYVTLSLGVATIFPRQKLSPSVLIYAADKALYTAKKNGRNCYYYLE